MICINSEGNLIEKTYLLKARVIEKVNDLFYINIFLSPLSVYPDLHDKLEFNKLYNMTILTPEVIEKSIIKCHPKDKELLKVIKYPLDYYMKIVDTIF